MKVFITGTVVDIQMREYVDKSGVTVKTSDVYLAPSNPRAAADRITVPVELIPTVGEIVGYWAEARAYSGKFGPVLSVRATEKAEGSASA
jgi:hypothetical protein